MQTLFYVSHDGEDIGPFSKSQIEQKLKAKEVDEQDYVFVEDKDDWVLVADWLKASARPKVVAQMSPSPTEVKKTSEPMKKFEPLQVTQARSAKSEVVRATHGEAQVSMRNDKAGLVSLQIEAPGLQSPSALEIKFIAGPVSQFVVDGPTEGRAGEVIKLTARALDKFGNITQFDDGAKIEAHPPVDGLPAMTFRSGVGSAEIKHSKVEAVEFKITGIQGVHTAKSHRVHFKAGKATRIVVETPKEAQVGQETLIHVKAVDAFGNIDVTFADVVTVKLGGVMSGETQVRLSHGQGSLKLGDKNVG